MLEQRNGGAQIDTRLHRAYVPDPLPQPWPAWKHVAGWIVVCAVILAVAWLNVYGA